MDRITTFCDVCGAQKKEGNNWIKAATWLNNLIMICTFDSYFDERWEKLDICSDACAHRKLDEVLKLRTEGISNESKTHNSTDANV